MSTSEPADGGKRCSCGAGCATYGECLRGKGLMVGSRNAELYRRRHRELFGGQHPKVNRMLQNWGK